MADVTNTGLPPELEALGQLLDVQPANVREIFQYSVAMLLVENHKAAITERHIADEREYVMLCTVAGDVFSVVKPNISDDLLDQMMIMAREALFDDDENAQDEEV